jgi:hypothetical protein
MKVSSADRNISRVAARRPEANRSEEFRNVPKFRAVNRLGLPPGGAWRRKARCRALAESAQDRFKHDAISLNSLRHCEERSGEAIPGL